jgi:hypothetical protein
MKTYTKQEAKNFIIGQVRAGNVHDLETDNDGQLLVHTGIYLWDDESLHDEPQPKEEIVEETKPLEPFNTVGPVYGDKE